MTLDTNDPYRIVSIQNPLRISEVMNEYRRGNNIVRGVLDHNRKVAAIIYLDIDHRQIMRHEVFSHSRPCDLWGFRLEPQRATDQLVVFDSYSRMNSEKFHTQGFFKLLYATVYSLIDFEETERPNYQPTKDDVVDIIHGTDPDNILGCALKQEAHVEGLAHRVCAILLVRDGQNGMEYLIPKASATQTIDRGLYHSAAGHIRSGETSVIAAVRGLHAKCGLTAKPRYFQLIDQYWLYREHPQKIENEYFDIYLVKCDESMGELICNEEQIEPRWISHDQLVVLYQESPGQFSLPLRATMRALLPRLKSVDSITP